MTQLNQYRHDINGLRAIAILLVIAFHLFGLNGGFIGVDIFFVISGFLISGIIFAGLKEGSFTFTEFYSKRIRRIFPALLFVLLASIAIGWIFLLPSEYEQLGKHIFRSSYFVSNFTLLKETGYFDSAAETKPLLHLWSLAIEEQFYILWPLILWVGYKKKLNLLAITICLCLGSFAFGLYETYHNRSAAFYLPHARVWELLLGAALAYYQDRISTKSSNGLSIVGFSLIAIGVAIITKDRNFPGALALLPTLGTAFIIAAGADAWLNRRILCNKILVWIGLISYPLYLWHWVLFSFIRLINNEPLSLFVRISIGLASFVLAWLTYRFVEQWLRYGKNLRIKTIALCIVMAIVGIGGYYSLYQFRGLAFRFPSEVRQLVEIIQFDEHDFNRPDQSDECLSGDLKTIDSYKICFETSSPIVWLWGDSYAAALYPGLKKLQDKIDFGMIQTTDNACPAIVNLKAVPIAVPTVSQKCADFNRRIITEFAKIKPQIFIMHSNWLPPAYKFTTVELVAKLTATVKAIKNLSPNTRIILIGSVPKWRTSPQKTAYLYYKNHNLQKISSLPDRLDAEMQIDAEKAIEKLAQANNIEYISALKALCDKTGCIYKVGPEATDFIAVDYGHLSRAGSEYFIEKISEQLNLGNQNGKNGKN